MDMKFECERYVRLTDQERYNLVLLKIFRNLQWYNEKSKFVTGNCFGNLALKDTDHALRFDDNITTVSRTGFVVLDRHRFFRIYNRMKERQAKDRLEIILQMPLFKEFSYTSKSELAKQSMY